MKRIILLCLLTVFLNFHFFSEIINWKGMEVGIDPNPRWLQNYINNKNDKLLRKKFDIPKSKRIIIGIGQSTDITNARYLSQINAQQQLNQESEKGKSVNLEIIYEYWMEDDKTGISVYSVYAL